MGEPRPVHAPALVESTVRRLRSALDPRSSPGWLRLGAVVTAAVCVAAGLAGSTAIANRAGALDDARGTASQLVDVQEARTAAVEADAIAATSFLVGGQEPAERRTAYEARLADASRRLTAVAQRARGGELDALGPANDALVAYAGLVEQARANNRQGFPVGAAYQRQASALLRSDVLANLDDVDDTSRGRLNSSMGNASTGTRIALALLVIAVVTLAGASALLYRRTRRLLNVSIVVGGALVLGALAWSASALSASSRDARNTVTSSLTSADALARARAAAFDAKSAESLTLVNRGNGAANEADWQLADARVVAALGDACAAAGTCLADEWAAYTDGHTKVRELDDGGDYDAAVSLALGLGGDDSSGPAAAFAEFASRAGDARVESARLAEAGLRDARSPLVAPRWFVLVAGLIAAAACVVGFGQRLREYR